MTILVCPLSHVPAVVAQRKPQRVISVLDPDVRFPELGPTYVDRHLRLSFHDAHAPGPGITVPSTQHVAQLLAFLEEWDDVEPLLVHCRAGIGRSTATAFVAACHRNPGVSERQIAIELRRVAPLARPNETLVKLADALLLRDGRMADAIAETGRGLPWIDVSEGDPFEMASQFEASEKG
jgi:predicted protein tyrosine phosphatase